MKKILLDIKDFNQVCNFYIKEFPDYKIIIKDIFFLHLENHHNGFAIKCSVHCDNCIRIIFIKNDALLQSLNDYPAEIIYIKNKLYQLSWMKNGLRHRFNNPAQIIYRDNKKVVEHYYLQGKRHNSNGPASRSFLFELKSPY